MHAHTPMVAAAVRCSSEMPDVGSGNRYEDLNLLSQLKNNVSCHSLEQNYSIINSACTMVSNYASIPHL